MFPSMFLSSYCEEFLHLPLIISVIDHVKDYGEENIFITDKVLKSYVNFL